MNRTCIHSVVINVVFCFVWFFFVISTSSADLPSIRNVHAEPVEPEDAQSIIESRGDEENQLKTLGLTGVDSGDRITELARGLKNDPNLIYKFVHDNIEYKPIYGYIKGPEMTLLDGCGNDFDQSSLLVALFRQAGFTANYVYGKIRLNPSQITDWLGIANDANVINRWVASAGIPIHTYPNPDGSLAYADLDHVWTMANINGTNYMFDPSFKSYSSMAGINLQSAMGYDGNTFLARASSGATIQPTYVRNINKSNMVADLNSYSTNLINYIKTNSPAATLQEIIGGRTIVPVTDVPYQTSLPYQQSITFQWTDIPNSYRVSLRIQHQGIDITDYSDQIYGKRLTIFYNTSNQPVLALDGSTLATGSAATSGTSLPLTLTVNHPYAANGGTYCDISRTTNITAGGSYLVINGWAGTGTKVIEEHRKILKQNIYAGGGDTSEPVLGESLAMMGFTWLAERSRANNITDMLTGTTTVEHHTLGVCGQYNSPYIDMPLCDISITSNTGDQSKETTKLFAASGQESAFEWGVVEQLQPHHAVSTIKLMDIANTGTYNKYFDANSSNYLSSIKSQLQNYNSAELATVESYINATPGYRVILPQNGNLGQDNWVGIGFIAISSDGSGMGNIISGGLSGGYGTVTWNVLSNSICASTETLCDTSWVDHSTSSEPIDLVTGDYLYENTDLAIGSGSYPFSLAFKRSYNSGEALDSNSMGLGWRHNLDITAKLSSDGFQGLGADSPTDAATSIVESYISTDMLSGTKTNLKIVVASIASRWFMDRLLNNVVTIDQPGNTMQFVRLADGNYNPPPGVAAKLTKQPSGSFLLKSKYGESLNFNTNGTISTWSDPNNTVTFTYSSGKLSKVSNTCGRFLSFTYDTNDVNRIYRITDSAGRNVYFNYDANDNLIRTTDANGFVTTYVYDPNNDGRITQIYYPTDLNNPYVTNIYDALGRVKTQTNANGYTYQYYYTGYRTEETDPCNYSNVYYFNDQGRLVSQTDPLGNQTDYEYDGQLRKTLVTYPRGNATQYIYDVNHNILQSIQIAVPGSGDPNIVETFTYEPNFNRMATYTDPNNKTTTYQYYSNGKVRQINQPTVDGNTQQTLFTYNSHGQTDTITDPNGMVTKNQYDPNGNLISIIVDYGDINITTLMTYNTVGDVNATTDPRGNITTYKYDAMRRLIKTTAPAPFSYITTYEYYPDGTLEQLSRQTDSPNQRQVTTNTYTPSGKIETVMDPNGDVTEYQYDALDRLWKTTDAENHTATRLYDAVGRLWKVIDANDNNSVIYTYNANGNIETITDAKGNTTTYQYDGQNRLKKTIFPDSTFEQLTYDAAGNISQRQARGGQTVSYSYDSLNRLKTKTLPGSQPIQYSYDLAGRLKAVTDISGTIQHSYDKAGRLLGVTYPDGKVVSYQYDAGGNRTRLTYPDSSYVSYNYDNMNRLTCILDTNGATIAHYDYDTLSRRTGAQFTDGTSTTYSYNIANRLLNLNNQMVISSQSFAYSYDSVGNRLTMTTDGANLHQYSYDKIYQLTGADYPAGFFAVDTTFNYDKAGNRSSVIAGGATNYATNNLNQYTSVGGITYSYDSNGNLTYDGNNTYAYDAENRLVTAAKTGNNVSYRYDPFGRRTQKTINGQITKYVYDGDQIIADCNTSGVMQRKYVYGPGIDEPICMIDSGNTYYYHYDGLGSVVALSGGVKFTTISAGLGFSLARKSNGLIVGWGNNSTGATLPPEGNDSNKISAGMSHALALKNDGSIVGWGWNFYGQATPPTGNNFVAISGGVEHSLALKSDGSIVGWGSTGTPPAGNNFVAISAGNEYSLALKSDGSIVGWGSTGTPPAGNNFVAIAAGWDHSLALKSDGSIVGWGNNSQGQTTTPSGNNFVAIAAGACYSLALKSDGSIVGWGRNAEGQATPPTGNDFVAIAAGFVHALALKSDGTIVGWGSNSYGEATPPPESTLRIVERYSYDVYGEPNCTSTVGNRYMFTGREYDLETGLYYYRARYYSPTLGRFLQIDPVGYSAGINWYAYCGNNPIGLSDPFGLCQNSYRVKANLWEAVGDTAGWIKNGIQTGLDVAGIWDPTGICDLANAAGYTGEALSGQGGWGNAAISAAAIIPYVGDLGKTEKYGSKALKYSEEASGFAKWLNKGPADVSVYKGFQEGEEAYVGITNSMIRRQGEWGNKLEIYEIEGGLTRNQGRAIEQVIIEQNPKYLNKINSISPDNPNYEQAIDWAKDYLRNP